MYVTSQFNTTDCSLVQTTARAIRRWRDVNVSWIIVIQSILDKFWRW